MCPQIKKDAVTALCDLLVHPETKKATIESGVIGALVGLSKASDVTLNQVREFWPSEVFFFFYFFSPTSTAVDRDQSLPL